MTNEEILEKLAKYADDDPAFQLDEDHSYNAEVFKQVICDWDVSDPFPADQLKRYIRFAEWTYKDFDYENELLVAKYLPDYCHDIFFKMKIFRENRRNELSSTQVVFSKMMGFKFETQDEKAACLYEYWLQAFYENSQIHKKD